jgi:hypothetical protein
LPSGFVEEVLMRRSELFLVAVLFVPVVLLAQNSNPASAPPAGAVSIQQLGTQAQPEKAGPSAPDNSAGPRIQPGSILYAELDKSLDAKKAKVGDPVVAKLQQSVLSRGKIAAPRGSKLIGRVTHARARTKENPQSELGIVFDRVVLKNGSQFPVSLSIQAIGAGPTVTNLTSTTDASMSSPIASPGMPGHTGNPGMLGNAGGSISDPAGPSGTTGDTATPRTTGPNKSGHVSASSHGVLGIANTEMANGTPGQGTLLTSDKQNVKLDSGNELVLRAQ